MIFKTLHLQYAEHIMYHYLIEIMYNILFIYKTMHIEYILILCHYLYSYDIQYISLILYYIIK